MSRFRPRFTVRRLMVAVAIVGMMLGMMVWLQRRSASLRIEADRHLKVWQAYIGARSSPPAWAEHHRRLAVKYSHAARYPWLPVEPDRPEPK